MQNTQRGGHMSSLDGTLGDFIRDANGGRVGGRDTQVFAEKHGLGSKSTMKALREQWKAAGRNNAQVFLRLTEADGSNPHYVTGFDGKGTFVCFTENGLQHVSIGKLQKLKLDENWNAKTLLMHVRAPYHQENVTRDGVDAMLAAARKVVTEDDKKGAVDTPYAKTPTGPQKAPPHWSGAPPAAPDGSPSAGKAPAKDAKPDESAAYSWDCCEERRAPKHPMMKGKDEPTAKDGHGEERQNVTTRHEGLSFLCAMCGQDRTSISQTEDVYKDVTPCPTCAATQVFELHREDTDAAQDKDEHGEPRNGVTTRSEGGSQKGSPSGQGNKADPQLDKRQQIDTRQEAIETKDTKHKDPQKAPKTTYWSDPIKDPEAQSRTEVPIRKEEKEGKSFEHPLAQCETFHPGKSHDRWIKQRWMLNNRGSLPEGPIQAKPQHEAEGAAYGHPLVSCKQFHPGKTHKQWWDMRQQLNNRGDLPETPLMLYPGQKKDATEADEGKGSLFAGTKKPKLLLILMARKHKMDEAKDKESKNPMPYKAIKRPEEETDRQDVDSRPEEGLTRSRLKLVNEDENGDPHQAMHSAHAHKFIANMMRMKQGLMRRKKKAQPHDGQGTSVLVMHDKPATVDAPGQQGFPHKAPPAFRAKAPSQHPGHGRPPHHV
jgi:hypothetical protein